MTKIITERQKRPPRVQLLCEDPTRTEQNHKDKVNINKIMARAEKTGFIPAVTGAHYGDFTTAVDFHESLNRIRDAERKFMTLPAQLRQRFKNDPGLLLDFVNNPENKAECIEMGLLQDPDVYVPKDVGTIVSDSEPSGSEKKETPPATAE